ncbi:MAG: tRNA uridine-5-carboxymethylaminomethyl(34) synthesis enzyme MnmG, partial [Nitrosospira sp.]
YRLQLREDNADLRLTGMGRELGVVDDARWASFEAKREAIVREQGRLKAIWLSPNTSLNALPEADVLRVLGKTIGHDYSLYELLRRPDVSYAALMTLPGAGECVTDPVVAEQVEIQAKYHGYIERQKNEVARNAGYEDIRLPLDLDYATVRGLSSEVQQKLNQFKPETAGQAARISGITPAAISLLLVHVKRGFSGQKKKKSA